MTYYLQALVLTCVVFFSLVGRRQVSWTLAAVPLIWFVGVSVIYWRYGPIGQWSFYQNDQYFHWKVVAEGFGTDFNLNFDRLNFFRFPYTAPAFLLSQIGIDPTLALKFASLVCAIATIALVERELKKRNARYSLTSFWLTASPILVFFSLLALRETMMALCVTHLFLGYSHPRKVLSLLALLILRPHMAAALVFGLAWGWAGSRLPSRWYLPTVLATALLPIYLGTIGFSVGNYIIYRLPLQLYQDLFLREQVIQIFSAFAGLQFFTVAYQTVEFTTRSLLLIRVIFPEIVLVPLFFTVSCFFYTPRTTRLKLSVLASFVFFMAVSSGTEYLSVRQTLPIMPIMGFAALLSFTRPKRAVETSQKNSTAIPSSELLVESVE